LKPDVVGISAGSLNIKQAISLDPGNARLVGELGDFYQRQGKLKAAEAAYMQMAKLAPEELAPSMILGTFYASQQNWEEALAWMRKAQSLQPENLGVQIALASLYMDMGKLDESEKLINSVLQKETGNIRGRFLKARLLLSKKQLTEAGALLDSIIKDQPRHAGAHYHRGLIYLAEKDQRKAKGSLLKTVQYNPGNLQARMLLAEIYLAERASDLALEELKVVLAREPVNYRAHLLQGNAYLLKQNIESARQAFEKAAEISPMDPAAYYQLARIDQLRGRHGEALSHLHKVLRLKSDHLPAAAAVVSVLMAQQQPEKALAFLDEKLRELQKDARLAAVLHQMQGRVLFAQKQYDQSEIAFEEAINLNPELLSPYLSLAALYQVRKETDKAIDQYVALLAKQPNFIQAYMALGAIYDAQGKSEEASKMYEKALEVNPDFAPAANNLAWTLLQKGSDTDRALALARKAKATLPDDPRVADTLALALITKGLYSSAISELSDAVQKMPRDPTVLYHLGLAYWKSDEENKAEEMLGRALETERPFAQQESARALLEKLQTAQ
jgi:tetratricopeptide (TPR) repeat protein